MPVISDGADCGVRYQDGVAAIAVRMFGRTQVPTLMSAAAAVTTNSVELAWLGRLVTSRLGLTAESLSVISTGLRTPTDGDYPRLYDSFLGARPYAGQRETWLIIRISAARNAAALNSRVSVGRAAAAAAQRVTAALRAEGIRACVATAAEVTDFEGRVGDARSRATEGGRVNTYSYEAPHRSADCWDDAWSWRVDAVTHNFTLFPDGSGTATVTVRTPQRPAAPPSGRLASLPGRQTVALTGNLCGPRPALPGVRRGPVPAGCAIPLGPTGVLVGKTAGGDQLLVPMRSPGRPSNVHIAAEDAVAKRLILRCVGSGERITVHTRRIQRWASIRMPGVIVTDSVRPAPGTTVSVVDGSLLPSPRPPTVIAVGPWHRQFARPDVAITQTGPRGLHLQLAGTPHIAEMELFRAENRYVSGDPIGVG